MKTTKLQTENAAIAADCLRNLRKWFVPTDELFDRFASNGLDDNCRVLDGHDPTRRRVFIDRGGSVLLVAHLDTVCTPRYDKRKRGRIYATGLDDRLGACIAYTLAERLGADLLLTDLEESCASTAEFHNAKSYNWIAEFDRMGDDVVTYGLESDDWYDALSDNWNVGCGSYSDICSLKTSACCVNVGIGYHRAHNEDSYCKLAETTAQIERFIGFYAEHHKTPFVQDRQRYDGYDVEMCDRCGADGAELIHGYWVCQPCIENMMMEPVESWREYTVQQKIER